MAVFLCLVFLIVTGKPPSSARPRVAVLCSSELFFFGFRALPSAALSAAIFAHASQRISASIANADRPFKSLHSPTDGSALFHKPRIRHFLQDKNSIRNFPVTARDQISSKPAILHERSSQSYGRKQPETPNAKANVAKRRFV